MLKVLKNCRNRKRFKALTNELLSVTYLTICYFSSTFHNDKVQGRVATYLMGGGIVNYCSHPALSCLHFQLILPTIKPSTKNMLQQAHHRQNKSVFSFLHKLTTWHYPHLSATCCAAVCLAAINRYFLPAGPTAANLQHWVCCCEPMLGQTDRQTDERPTDAETLLC